MRSTWELRFAERSWAAVNNFMTSRGVFALKPCYFKIIYRSGTHNHMAGYLSRPEVDILSSCFLDTSIIDIHTTQHEDGFCRPILKILEGSPDEYPNFELGFSSPLSFGLFVSLIYVLYQYTTVFDCIWLIIRNLCSHFCRQHLPAAPTVHKSDLNENEPLETIPLHARDMLIPGPSEAFDESSTQTIKWLAVFSTRLHSFLWCDYQNTFELGQDILLERRLQVWSLKKKTKN